MCKAGGHVRKNKPPHLSQARRPIQTLLTYRFPFTTIYNYYQPSLSNEKNITLVGAKLVKKPQFERKNHKIFLQTPND